MQDSCVMPVSGGSENSYGKVNILLQTYISRGSIENFSLVSDSAYVAQVKWILLFSFEIYYQYIISFSPTPLIKSPVLYNVCVCK